MQTLGSGIVRFFLPLGLIASATIAGGAFTGCSVSPAAATPIPQCTLISVMNPSVATADHAAAAPANSVTFDVGYAAASGTSCAIPQIVYLPTLTSSDTVNVALTNPGVATCIGTTTVPVILTDTRSKATATLTCK